MHFSDDRWFPFIPFHSLSFPLIRFYSLLFPFHTFPDSRPLRRTSRVLGFKFNRARLLRVVEHMLAEESSEKHSDFTEPCETGVMRYLQLGECPIEVISPKMSKPFWTICDVRSWQVWRYLMNLDDNGIRMWHNVSDSSALGCFLELSQMKGSGRKWKLLSALSPSRQGSHTMSTNIQTISDYQIDSFEIFWLRLTVSHCDFQLKMLRHVRAVRAFGAQEKREVDSPGCFSVGSESKWLHFEHGDGDSLSYFESFELISHVRNRRQEVVVRLKIFRELRIRDGFWLE